MPLVSEVTGLVKELADIVKNTREIVKAINDGRAYLARNHPNARADMDKLLGQIQHTIEGMAKVSALLSEFRFEFTGDAENPKVAKGELAQFNGYVKQQRVDIGDLRGRIRELKNDCQTVAELRNKLDSQTEAGTWGSMFGLLGKKARERAMELSGTLSNFYADDQMMIHIFMKTLDVAEAGIDEVNDVLGPPGQAYAYNIPDAAEVLNGYAILFRKPHRDLHKLADRMSDVRTALKS